MDITWGEQYLPNMTKMEQIKQMPPFREIKRTLLIWARRRRYNEITLQRLSDAALWNSAGNPAENPGAALRLAEKMGIQVCVGTSYGSVRAFIGDSWVDRPDICMAICDLALCETYGIKVKMMYTPEELEQYKTAVARRGY